MERREFVTATGMALAGAFAGCSAFPSGEDTSGNQTATEYATSEPITGTAQNPETDEDGSYSVSIEPMGEVRFGAVPETWVGNNGSWADMAVALGMEPPEALWLPSRYHTTYYDEIPKVSVDGDSISALYSDGVSKEQFYDLEGDVHIMDPNFLQNRYSGWEKSDIDDISDIAPLFGNSSFTHNYDWHSDYGYYTIEEAFEKLAKVFFRAEYYNEMIAVRNEFFQNISDVVPGDAADRPNVAVVWGGNQPDQFYAYHIGQGTSYRQYRPLYQGPITNMVVAERQAKQLYDADGELFDRQRVGEIVNGNL